MSYVFDLAKEVVMKCTDKMRQARCPGIICAVSDDPATNKPRLLLGHAGLTPTEALHLCIEMSRQLEIQAKAWLEANPALKPLDPEKK